MDELQQAVDGRPRGVEEDRVVTEKGEEQGSTGSRDEDVVARIVEDDVLHYRVKELEVDREGKHVSL